MPFDHDEDRQRYQEAEAALDTMAKSRTATTEQRAAARRARDDLTREFLHTAFTSMEARTRQFETFITQMEQVIADIGDDSAVPGLQQLQQVVDAGRILLENVRDGSPS